MRRLRLFLLPTILVASMVFTSGADATSPARTAATKTCSAKHGKKRCKTRKSPTPAPAPSIFDTPSGIAVDGQGNVYVSDSERDQVLKLDGNGHVLATFGGKGSATGTLDRPWGLAVDAEGSIFVAEAGITYGTGPLEPAQHDVLKLSPDGKVLARWAFPARPEYSNTAPCGIAFDPSGNLLVTGFLGYEIVKFSPSGQVLGTIPTDDPAPCGIVVDRASTIYVTQGRTENIGVYARDGTKIRTIGSADNIDPGFGLTADAEGNLVTVNFAHTHVKRFSTDGRMLARWGSYGSGKGQMRLDERQFLGVAVDAQGTIYVADPGNARVDRFTSSGASMAPLR